MNQIDIHSQPTSLPRAIDEDLDRIKNEFGDRLRQAFDGATNAEIARRCDTTRAVIKEYVDGNRLPMAELLLRMRRATGVSIDWLLTGRGSRRVEISNVFSKEEEERIREFARKQGLTFDQTVQQLSLAALDVMRRF